MLNHGNVALIVAAICIVGSLRSLCVQENLIINNVTVVDEYLFEERLKDF